MMNLEADLRNFQIVALMPACGVEAKLLIAAVQITFWTNVRSMPSSISIAAKVCLGRCYARPTIATSKAKISLTLPARTILRQASCLLTTSTTPSSTSPTPPMRKCT